MLWKAILLQFLRFAISQNTKIKCCAPLLKHTTKTRNKTSYKSFILPGIVSNITWYIYAKENLLNHYSCTLKLYFDIFHSFFCFRLKQQLLQLPRLSTLLMNFGGTRGRQIGAFKSRHMLMSQIPLKKVGQR